ncbi:MAG TPA: response regulator [Candidatus Methylomirabilis sp.]|nr:response regulator [Candidatus Methylomirabilis sp.]
MGDSYPSVLCVDDDPAVLEQLKEHFTLQGFIVLTASNGVEACLQVKRWAPKAVILDLLIPRLGGIGTLARIRAFNPSIPVILVSDTTDSLELVTEAGLNVTGAFAKPLDLSAISEALGRAGITVPTVLSPSPSARRNEKIRARVLLVDDEPQFREMLAEYLASENFEVLEAACGEEALPHITSWRPDLVLLDLMMAGIGGLETLRRIKAMRPDTCVIMVTAVDDLDVARSALAAGAADYVTKPFTFQYLDAVLDIHMPSRPADSRHSDATAPAASPDGASKAATTIPLDRP